jgi:DNA polymerase-3 subunit delta'
LFQCSNPQLNNEGYLEACDLCSSCKKVKEFTHLDVHYFFPIIKRKNKTCSDDYFQEWIEYLRSYRGIIDLNSWIRFIDSANSQAIISAEDCDKIVNIAQDSSYEGKYKIFIIWEMERLFHAAAPKLLKIIEEPPAKTLFVGITDHLEQVLSTIRSRMQIIQIPTPTPEESLEILNDFFDIEKDEAKRLVFTYGNNLPRIVDNIHTDKMPIAISDFFIKWMRLSFQLKAHELLDLAIEFNSLGRDIQKITLSQCLNYLDAIWLINHNIPTQLILNELDEKFVHDFKKFIDDDTIADFACYVDEAIKNIERNADSKIVFFDLSFKIGQTFKQKYMMMR